ncbi:MAG TPA: DNA gyrase inhibitor YacG [Steroidobacteraceae bacterium]|nr:DNA gyrase inhibitor YacG [Steroidobacteraceae bacterium]
MHVSTTVQCPTCDRVVQWNASSPWRPFCSERCKLIDLGAWASEQHAIPGNEIEAEDKPKTEDEESG